MAAAGGARSRETMTDLLSNPNTASVPAHVREAVLNRMKLLRQRDRSIVMFASVIGGRFDVALLSAAAGYAPDEARRALEEACSLQLLEADGDSECFWFRHALTREVVYRELLAARARPLHRRIARALERGSAGASISVENLAYHWWAAGNAKRALLYNERAGDLATAVFAADVARMYYDRALGCLAVGSAAYARLAEKIEHANDHSADHLPAVHRPG